MPTSKTPITVEQLLEILDKSMTVAGYQGTCERVIAYDQFVQELKKLL